MRRALVLALVLALTASACGREETVNPETADPGAYSVGREVFVVYPDNAPPVVGTTSDFTKCWFAEAEGLGFGDFVSEDGTLSSSVVDDDLRIWVDVGSSGYTSPADVVQMLIENRATEEEDAVYVDDVIPVFLHCLGVDGARSDLGLDDAESLFDEGRTAEVTVDGVHLYLAMNKFTLVLGAAGG